MTDWHDDQGVFYERSAGRLTSGNDDPEFVAFGPEYRPSALYLSTNIREVGGTYHATDERGGYVWLDYGDSGNVVAMTVHGQCRDVDATHLCETDPSDDLDDRKDALEAGCLCAQEQHYRYDWDELNRLGEARRYDRSGGTGVWALAVQQRYRYSSGNVRLIKETIDHVGSPFSAVTLTPFPGDFERRGLVLDTLASTYNNSPTLGTESQYNVGGARLVWGTDDTPTADLNRLQRLTLPLSDLVQSTAAVVDLQSGDLLEHTTFYPNGARETHRTNDDVSMQLEPVGFTGKEADEEVGLVYFGERYLIPRLGRWASADPLSVHGGGGGEALNGYHYVSGNLLQARDPLGLQEDQWPTDSSGSDGGRVVFDNAILFGSSGPGEPPPAAPPSVGPATRPSGPPTTSQMQATRLWRDARFRETAEAHANGSFVDTIAGVGRVIFQTVCSVGMRYSGGCNPDNDLIGRLEDLGIDTGVDRYSIQYGHFATGPNLQDALFSAIGGIFSRVPTGAGTARISSGTTGNPSAISRGYGNLSRRQQSVLDELSGAGSSVIIRRRGFGQRDLAALTAQTGDEFASS